MLNAIKFSAIGLTGFTTAGMASYLGWNYFLGSGTQDSDSGNIGSNDRIIRTNLVGTVSYDSKMLDRIYQLAEDTSVKGVLVRVNSGGGLSTASEALYLAFEAVSKQKPLVISVEGVCTSGAYMACLPGKIFTLNSSHIGSIGAIIGPIYDSSELNRKMGIEPFYIRSSPLKSFLEYDEICGLPIQKKPDEAGMKALQEIVDESYNLFKETVLRHRSIAEEHIDTAFNGDAFLGKKALEMGLTDKIGSAQDALNCLKHEYGISPDLPVVDYEIMTSLQPKC